MYTYLTLLTAETLGRRRQNQLLSRKVPLTEAMYGTRVGTGGTGAVTAEIVGKFR